MRRRFVEVDGNVVVDVHEEEVKDSKGKGAREPKKALRKRKATNKVRPDNIANIGDVWSEQHGCFLRMLPRTDEQSERAQQKDRTKKERELRVAHELNVSVRSRR